MTMEERNPKLKNYFNQLPQPPWSGPPFPSSTESTWGKMQHTMSNYLMEVRSVIKPGLRAKVQPDVIYLLYKTVSTAALDATAQPGTLVPWIAQVEKIVSHDGKWSKMTVSYVDINPPPLFWDYKCGKCRWFQAPRNCKVVAGDISRGGWCAIWIPAEGTKMLTWPKDLFKGDW